MRSFATILAAGCGPEARGGRAAPLLFPQDAALDVEQADDQPTNRRGVGR